eukprot:1007121-Pleurochrysis_carterae.AAC.2
MEGDKGGGASGLVYTGKCFIAQRWVDYKAFRGRLGRPFLAKTHPKCDDCGKLEFALDSLGKRSEAEAVAERAKTRCASEMHGQQHAKERKYFNQAWYCGGTYP